MGLIPEAGSPTPDEAETTEPHPSASSPKGGPVPTLVKTICSLAILTVAVVAAYPQKTQPVAEGPTTLVITFKDGHQQTFSMSDIARVQYVGAADATLGPEYFLGKWEVGDGNSGTFVIALESNGEASKTLGASHGIWTIEGDEARISWDDGWHDAIRKVNSGDHEKLAYLPGTTFSDKPENITNARKLGPDVDFPRMCEGCQKATVKIDQDRP